MKNNKGLLKILKKTSIEIRKAINITTILLKTAEEEDNSVHINRYEVILAELRQIIKSLDTSIYELS